MDVQYQRIIVVVAAAVVRTRPRAIPLVMITMRKSTHGFPFVSHIWVAYGAPLGCPSGRRSCLRDKKIIKFKLFVLRFSSYCIRCLLVCSETVNKLNLRAILGSAAGGKRST